MTPVASKVCVVGDFAVGKTSVVERFVNSQFSDKYLSTVGVKIDTKEIELPDLGIVHKLVIWDVAGTDRFDHTEFAYLRGAGGYIYVVDGTRPSTLDVVTNIREQINEKYGAAPSVVLVNKFDLESDWSISDDRFESLKKSYDAVYRTSAKTGQDVEQALNDLSELIIKRDMQCQ